MIEDLSEERRIEELHEERRIAWGDFPPPGTMRWRNGQAYCDEKLVTDEWARANGGRIERRFVTDWAPVPRHEKEAA